MSHDIRERTFGYVRPAKIQIGLTFKRSNQKLHWIVKEAKFIHVDNEDSDQGLAVQSTVSLTSSLVVKMSIVLVSTVPNSQVFLLKKCE